MSWNSDLSMARGKCREGAQVIGAVRRGIAPRLAADERVLVRLDRALYLDWLQEEVTGLQRCLDPTAEHRSLGRRPSHARGSPAWLRRLSTAPPRGSGPRRDPPVLRHGQHKRLPGHSSLAAPQISMSRARRPSEVSALL
jgi:hypothetical protein